MKSTKLPPLKGKPDEWILWEDYKVAAPFYGIEVRGLWFHQCRLRVANRCHQLLLITKDCFKCFSSVRQNVSFGLLA